MGIDTSAPVVLSGHAIKRIEERWPHLVRGTRSTAGFANWEDQQAMQAGRTSKKLPREYRRPGMNNRAQSATKVGRKWAKGMDTPSRFVWSADQARCYVLHWKQNDKFGGTGRTGAHRKIWVCSTVLPLVRVLPGQHPDLMEAADG